MFGTARCSTRDKIQELVQASTRCSYCWMTTHFDLGESVVASRALQVYYLSKSIFLVNGVPYAARSRCPQTQERRSSRARAAGEHLHRTTRQDATARPLRENAKGYSGKSFLTTAAMSLASRYLESVVEKFLMRKTSLLQTSWGKQRTTAMCGMFSV